jgi:hypothetical protein
VFGREGRERVTEFSDYDPKASIEARIEWVNALSDRGLRESLLYALVKSEAHDAAIRTLSNAALNLNLAASILSRVLHDSKSIDDDNERLLRSIDKFVTEIVNAMRKAMGHIDAGS